MPTDATHDRIVLADPIAALLHVPRRGSAPHPVLCFLHGKGEAAKERTGAPDRGLDLLLKNGSPPFHADKGSRFIQDFIVVSPQLECEGRWPAEDSARIDALMQKVIEQYAGDPAKLYLTGFSNGGDAVFLFARSNTRWAALWSVDPALTANTPRPQRGQSVWLHHGTSRRHVSDQDLDAFIEAASLEAARPGDDANRQTRLLTDTGVPHVETSQAAYADARVYEWLRRRPCTPS
jgi:dienelactone hydrolase